MPVAAVVGLHVRRETKRTVVVRGQRDASERINPFAGEPASSKSLCDVVQYSGALAKRHDEVLAELVLVGFLYGACGFKDHFVEPGLITLQKRSDISRRFRQRGIERSVDRSDELVVTGLAAIFCREAGAVAVDLAAEGDSGRLAAPGAQIGVHRLADGRGKRRDRSKQCDTEKGGHRRLVDEAGRVPPFGRPQCLPGSGRGR